MNHHCHHRWADTPLLGMELCLLSCALSRLFSSASTLLQSSTCLLSCLCSLSTSLSSLSPLACSSSHRHSLSLLPHVAEANEMDWTWSYSRWHLTSSFPTTCLNFSPSIIFWVNYFLSEATISSNCSFLSLSSYLSSSHSSLLLSLSLSLSFTHYLSCNATTFLILYIQLSLALDSLLEDFSLDLCSAFLSSMLFCNSLHLFLHCSASSLPLYCTISSSLCSFRYQLSLSVRLSCQQVSISAISSRPLS